MRITPTHSVWTQSLQVLAALVYSTPVLARFSTLLSRDCFLSDEEYKVAAFCYEWYMRYGVAPMQQLALLIELDNEPNEFAKRILELDYTELPCEAYLNDLVCNYFERNRLSRLSKEIQRYINSNQIEAAKKLVTNYTPTSLGSKWELLELDDATAYLGVLDKSLDREACLIEYSGALGELVGNAFQRERLIAFMGPEKAGKSFWLTDCAVRAYLRGYRVVYFECGDLSTKDLLFRVASRLLKLPIRAGRYRVIQDILEGHPIEATLVYTEDQVVTSGKFAKLLSLIKPQRPSKTFFLNVHLAQELSVSKIESYLENLVQLYNYVPDIIIVDYADLLAPPNESDWVQSIDFVWRSLRKISLKYHCLVVTASQVNTLAYQEKKHLTRAHFSGRRTKLAHVNGMIGLLPLRNGLLRVNWVVRREGPYREDECVLVAPRFCIALPCYKSVADTTKT